MSNKFFYVHNGLTVGALNVDASSGNLQTSGVLSSTNVTNASSTITGSLILAGGAGIGGNLYAAGVYSGGAAVWTTATLTNLNQLTNGPGYLTSATLGNFGVSAINGTTYIGVSGSTGSVTITNLGVQTLTAGTDTAVSASTGTITVWSTSTLQSITARGATTPSAISITNTTASTSTNSGALQVTGGVGIGGALYAGNIFDNGNRVLTSVTPTAGTAITITSVSTSNGNTTFTVNNNGVTSLNGTTYIGVSASTGSITLTNLGVQTLTAGTDTSVSSSTGTITVWNNSTLQTITNRGATTTNIITINTNTVSASTSSGQALLVAGGVGALRVVASEVYDGSNRVLTNVVPSAGTGISVTSVSTSNGTMSFTVNNTGVTSAVGTTYLGVSTSTGAVTFTNLGVQSLSGTTYLGVSSSTGTITLTNLGVQTLTAGTDTAVSASTGTVTVWSTSTLQSVTNRGATTNNAIRITNTTQSTTATDGALIVDGGVGIGKNLNVGGTFNVWGGATFGGPVTFNGTATYVYSTNTVYTDNIIELHTTATGVNGTWTFDDGKDVGLRFHYYNRTTTTDTNAALVLANDTQWLEWYSAGAESNTGTFAGATYGVFKTGQIRLVSGVNASSTTTGDLTITGGLGVGGNAYFGGTVYSNGVALSNFSTGTLVAQAITATNIAGGLAGFIPIQSAAGQTSFIGTGTNGYILKMGVNTATWVDINTLITISSTATNLAGGATGSIPYQTASGLTGFIGIGAAGTVLQSNGTTATYVTTASLVVGSAQLANTATNLSGGTVNATTIQASGVSTFTNNVVVSSSPVVYDQTGTSVGITAVTVDSFPVATYRSAKYVVTISNSGNSAYQSTEVLIIHDGTTPYLYDTSVFTGANPIMTFTTTISGGNVLLQGTGTATGNVVKVQRVYTTV